MHERGDGEENSRYPEGPALSIVKNGCGSTTRITRRRNKKNNKKQAEEEEEDGTKRRWEYVVDAKSWGL
jgi:hypothetical protein